jgi:hypothetical protein
VGDDFLSSLNHVQRQHYQRQHHSRQHLLFFTTTTTTTTTTSSGGPNTAESSFVTPTLDDVPVRPAHLSVDKTVPQDSKSSAVGADGITVPTDETVATTTTTSSSSKTKSYLHKNRPIFPWRHETTLIPRLIHGTSEYKNDVLGMSLRGQAFISSLFLKMPLYQIFIHNEQWRSDLANSCAWAFAQGVGGMLSNVYSIPQDEIFRRNNNSTRTSNDDDDNDGKFDFTFPPLPTNDDKKEKMTNEDGDDVIIPPPPQEEGNINDNKEENDNNSNNRTSLPTNDNDLDMICRPLRNLFQSAHQSGRDQLQIKLQTEPVRATLYNVFCFPYVSREAIEHDPELLNRTRAILQLSRTSPIAAFNLLQDHVDHELQLHDELRTTVEVQVIIECNELFQVIDRETGLVVQGSVDGKIQQGILHVVRFESTVITKAQESFPYLVSSKPGNWKITDIDDVISPTAWYNV